MEPHGYFWAVRSVFKFVLTLPVLVPAASAAGDAIPPEALPWGSGELLRYNEGIPYSADVELGSLAYTGASTLALVNGSIKEFSTVQYCLT